MTTRQEEEMAQLRKRYARMKGKMVPEEVAPTTIREPEKVERRKNKGVLEPYLFLIKDDIRRLFRMKSKLPKKEKPLDLTWLEKKGGNSFEDW